MHPPALEGRRRCRQAPAPGVFRLARASASKPSTTRGETVCLGDGRSKIRALVRPEYALEVLEAQSEGGHRRAKLVRGVGDEGPLNVEQLLQSVCHFVDRRPEGSQLGWALPDRGPLRQHARAEGSDGGLNTGKGTCEEPASTVPTAAVIATMAAPNAASLIQSSATRASKAPPVGRRGERRRREMTLLNRQPRHIKRLDGHWQRNVEEIVIGVVGALLAGGSPRRCRGEYGLRRWIVRLLGRPRAGRQLGLPPRHDEDDGALGPSETGHEALSLGRASAIEGSADKEAERRSSSCSSVQSRRAGIGGEAETEWHLEV